MKLTEKQLIRWIKKMVAAAGSQTAAAKEFGISPSYLHDVLHGRRDPGKKILDRLGLRRIEVSRSYTTGETEAK